MTTYLSLAISDSMFPPGLHAKRALTPDEVRDILGRGVVSCVNPAHRATVDAIQARYGLEIAVPERAEKVALAAGDRLLVCTALGLPRETREFTDEEIARATFAFSLWSVGGEQG